MTPRAATPVQSTNSDEIGGNEKSTVRGKTVSECSVDESVNGLKRANRPPDLNLSPGRTSAVPVELANQKLVSVAVIESLRSQSAHGDFDPGRSSTPTKHSGSISERVSLVYKKNACKSVVLSLVNLLRRLPIPSVGKRSRKAVFCCVLVVLP